MSANELIYQLGVTQIAVGLSLNAQFIAPRICKSISVKYTSGGTLALVQGLGSNTYNTANGYVLGTSEVVSANGPVTFFLAATGATAIASVILGYAQGYSL